MSAKNDKSYVIRLLPGEDLRVSIEKFLIKKHTGRMDRKLRWQPYILFNTLCKSAKRHHAVMGILRL